MAGQLRRAEAGRAPKTVIAALAWHMLPVAYRRISLPGLAGAHGEARRTWARQAVVPGARPERPIPRGASAAWPAATLDGELPVTICSAHVDADCRRRVRSPGRRDDAWGDRRASAGARRALAPTMSVSRRSTPTRPRPVCPTTGCSRPSPTVNRATDERRTRHEARGAFHRRVRQRRRLPGDTRDGRGLGYDYLFTTTCSAHPSREPKLTGPYTYEHPFHEPMVFFDSVRDHHRRARHRHPHPAARIALRPRRPRRSTSGGRLRLDRSAGTTSSTTRRRRLPTRAAAEEQIEVFASLTQPLVTQWARTTSSPMPASISARSASHPGLWRRAEPAPRRADRGRLDAGGPAAG